MLMRYYQGNVNRRTNIHLFQKFERIDFLAICFDIETYILQK